MIVVNVFFSPAFSPLGGTLVTLIVFYNKPKGNLGLYSQVIQSLKSSCIEVFNVLPSGIIIVSISSMNLSPK